MAKPVTHDEFNYQIQRICQTFSRTVYGEERLRMIWSYCQNLTSDALEIVVDQIICEFKYAPLPSDFREIIRSQQKRGDVPIAECEISCFDCEDKGLITVKGNTRVKGAHNGKLYHARCHCPRGLTPSHYRFNKQEVLALPRYSHSYKADFDIIERRSLGSYSHDQYA